MLLQDLLSRPVGYRPVTHLWVVIAQWNAMSVVAGQDLHGAILDQSKFVDALQTTADKASIKQPAKHSNTFHQAVNWFSNCVLISPPELLQCTVLGCIARLVMSLVT